MTDPAADPQLGDSGDLHGLHVEARWRYLPVLVAANGQSGWVQGSIRQSQ